MARLIYFRKKDGSDASSLFEHDPVKMISGSCQLIALGEHTIERYPANNLSEVSSALKHLVVSNAFPLDGSVIYGLHTQRSFRQILDWISRFLNPQDAMYPQQLLAVHADLVECMYNSSTISLTERLNFSVDTIKALLPDTDFDMGDPLHTEIRYLQELARYYG
jgi:hypothetical protein